MTSGSGARRTAVLTLGIGALLLCVARHLISPTATPYVAIGLIGALVFAGLLALTLKALDDPLDTRGTALLVLTSVAAMLLVDYGTPLGIAVGAGLAVAASHGRTSQRHASDEQRRRTLRGIGIATGVAVLVGTGVLALPSLLSWSPGDTHDLAAAFAVMSAIVAAIGLAVYAGLMALTVGTRNRALGIANGALTLLASVATAYLAGHGLTFAVMAVNFAFPPTSYAHVFVPHLLAQCAGLALGAYAAVVATADRPTADHPVPLATA